MNSFIKRLPLLILAGLILAFIFLHRQVLTSTYDAPYWLDHLYHSAYYQGDKAAFILSDADYYAVRGYLLIHDFIDPASLPPSHPPLAQYLLGLSTAIFANPYIISLLAGLLTLFIFYRITQFIFHSTFLSSLLTLILFIEPIFNSQLTDSMLDIFLLLFILTSLLFYLYWQKNNRPAYLLLSQLFLGLAAATKFFPTVAPFMAALLFTTILTGNFKKFLHHLFALSFIILGFTLGHFSYFYYHLNPLDFIRYQRYVISWWAGSPQVPPLLVWDLLFFNRWHTWWGNQMIQSIPEWHLNWPVLSIISFLSLPLVFLRKTFTPSILPLFFSLIFALLLFSFEAVYPRHLFLLIPLIYLLPLFIIYNPKSRKLSL